MSTERQQLEAGIRALESQRALLGDAVVDAMLAPARAKLAALRVAASPAEPAQTLKQVSILFLDVVGSTTLSQKLVPEDVSAAMDGLLERGTAIVQAHGGRVLQYAGDNLLAAFGVDAVQEDDPERAVRAGLALLQEGRLQGELVESQHGYAGFNVRVGIHTGEVLLGGGVDAEGSIRGQTVNVAARMEQTAPPGGLRISNDTYRHVRGLFNVDEQPPLEIKGLSERIVTYLVQYANPRPFRGTSRGIDGVSTEMVGRDDELEQLQESYLAVLSEPTFVPVAVVAEPGLGKSRLLAEFRRWVDARGECGVAFQGRANPQTQGQPYGLLRDMLAGWLLIADTDTVHVARGKVERSVVPLFTSDHDQSAAETNAHLLGHLIGVDFADSPYVRGIVGDPPQLRQRAFFVAGEVLRRLGRRNGGPVLVYLEDLHWSDDESLDFLEHLADNHDDVSILVVGLFRPSLYERREGWIGSHDSQRRISLEPLESSLSHKLVAQLLAKVSETPRALEELIVSGAEGNPFYMEELVNMLVDRGAIEPGPDLWTVRADRLDVAKVPSTLTGVLQARLDGLPIEERLALQQASVIGPIFWDAALASLDARAPNALPGLVNRQMALPRPNAALENVSEYAFRHHLLHQVTYETLLRRDRRALHARAAAWLAKLKGVRAEDFLGATGEHYERAGDFDNACEFYARAAERSIARFAHDASLAYSTRALDLLDAGNAGQALLRWRPLAARDAALDLLGKRHEQLDVLVEMESLAEALNDDRKRSEAASRHAHLCLRTKSPPSAWLERVWCRRSALRATNFD